jgi:ATP-binding cassette subfamily C protein
MRYRIGSRIRSGTFSRAVSLLSPRDRKLGLYVIFINVGLGILDLIGVASIGLVGSLAVVGVSSGVPNKGLDTVLQLLHLDNLSFQMQATVLASTACLVFLSRTVASVYLTRRILHFLSQKGAQMSSTLLSKLISLPVNELNSRTVSQINYVLNDGVTAITLGIIGLTLGLFSDLVLLMILTIGLFIINPSIAITSIISFGITGVIVYTFTRRRAKRIGEQNANLSVKLYSEISFLISNFREIFVKAKLDYHKSEIDKLRTQLASTLAEQQFLPNISKYIIESSLILIGLLVSAVQFVLNDALGAVSALSIFLAAGSRLAPTVMRMQQNAIQIRSNTGIAETAMELILELERVEVSNLAGAEPDFIYQDFCGRIELKNCDFKYDSSSNFALDGVSLVIEPGEQIAIVGPSGSGKSTLTDLILGVLIPTGGSIKISGVAPRDAIKKWPGAIGYVPQEVRLSYGTLIENITKGFQSSDFEVSRLRDLIALAQLKEMQSDLESTGGIILDQGTNLSGGQKQRLGIARALFTNPKLLVLDEATSALDGQTEQAISSAIQSLKGSVTVIMIAHRLSTVREADKIIYLDRGRVLACGSIDEVRQQVPDFHKQAQLMGL